MYDLPLNTLSYSRKTVNPFVNYAGSDLYYLVSKLNGLGICSFI